MPRGRKPGTVVNAAPAEKKVTKVKVDVVDQLLELMHTFCCELNDDGRRFISGAQRIAMETELFRGGEAKEEVNDETD